MRAPWKDGVPEGRTVWFAALVVVASGALNAEPGHVSFTPTGFRISIMSISIVRDDGSASATLYTCPGATEEECLVDVTQQSEVDRLAAADVEVPLGLYDRVSVQACAPDKSPDATAPAFLLGQFEVGGITYYTDPNEQNSTGSKAVAPGGFMRVRNWACAPRELRLGTPLDVTEDGSVSLTLLLDSVFAAHSSAATPPDDAGCRAPSSGSLRGVCASYPVVFAQVGGSDAQLKRFVLAHHASDQSAIVDGEANAYLVAAVDGAGIPFMAHTRPYFTEPSTSAGPLYGNPTDVRSFVGEGSGVSFDTGTAADVDAVVVRGFSLDDHVGTVNARDGRSWFVHAIPRL